jgi:hypothetical protein
MEHPSRPRPGESRMTDVRYRPPLVRDYDYDDDNDYDYDVGDDYDDDYGDDYDDDDDNDDDVYSNTTCVN